MLIDMCGYLGHWPFRKINNNDAESFVKVMDDYKINLSVVSSLNAVFYKDTMQGNEEIAEEIKPYSDRLVAFCVINPAYPAWEKDFRTCIEKLGMKGLMMYPYYHPYRLTEANAIRLANLAGEAGIPVHIPVSIINVRQRHWLDTTEILNTSDFIALIKNAPNTDFIVSNGATDAIAAAAKDADSKRKGKVYYDFQRVEVFLPSFERLLATVGPEQIVLGTGNPLQYLDTQFVKLHYMDVSDEVKDLITYKNAARLLKLA
jgi:predicted TIM-barrel fold metal-dependent hydrolase